MGKERLSKTVTLLDASRRHEVDSKLYGTALLKGLEVLKCFTPDPHERGITELAGVLGLAKSTILRVVRSLEAEGFLHRVPASGKYRLGLVLWSLGKLAFEGSRGFAEFARPYLNELVNATHESAQTVIFDGLECVRLDKVEAPQAVRAYMSEGGRFPAYVSAAGQALLAFQSAATISSVVRHGLQAYTRRTLTTRTELERRLSQVRRQGYAASAAEYREDIGGFGAPIRDAAGAVVGALGIVIPMPRFPTGVRARRSAQALVEAANRLSRDLGYIDSGVELRRRDGPSKREVMPKAPAVA